MSKKKTKPEKKSVYDNEDRVTGKKAVFERLRWFEQEVRKGVYPNASSLCKKYGISVNTAQADIQFIQNVLKCPILYDSHSKGYHFREGTSWTFQSIYLSEEELTALLAAKQLLEGVSCVETGDSTHGISGELSKVLDKITAIIGNRSPVPFKTDDVFSVQFIESAPANLGFLQDIMKACIEKKCISIEYTSAKNETKQRTVEPYHLLNYMGTWHLIGYCHLCEDLRDFAVVYISKLEIGETFGLVKGLHKYDVSNIKEYVQKYFGRFQGEWLSNVKLRFSPEISRWIRYQNWHEDQKKEVLTDGSIELDFPVSSYLEVTGEILKHGEHVEVIEPQEVRDIIREKARKILELYK